MISVRESFGGKLLSVLFVTVALLTTVTFSVVRLQMSREVDAVEERTALEVSALFGEVNRLQRDAIARAARPFIEGVRAPAMLMDAIDTGDPAELVTNVDYEMQLALTDDYLAVFTDQQPTPVVSLVGGRETVGGDPAGILPLAEALIVGGAPEMSGYRYVDDRLYVVRTSYIEAGFRLVGTVTFGLPVDTADVGRVSRVGGFEACLYADGRCVIQTVGVEPELAAALSRAAGAPETDRREIDGSDYLLRSDPLVPERPEDGWRVIAVPLDPVLAPFEQIQRALLLGGGAALLLSALLGAVLSRSLTRPVKELVVAVGRVARGDFETEVRVDSSDEMGTLASAFNDMTEGLLRRERERAVLDKVVSQEIADELLRGDVELGGENREVSVLFADIRGFTPMTRGMEPQEVITFLNECMEHLSVAVDAEGGVVDKFIGDELMAVFGAPARFEDHAMRAVRAALSMQEGIEQLNVKRAERGEAPVGVGIGINSGLAVAGNMGSRDRLNYTVLGETVNLAARLVNQAGSGQVLISAETLRRAGGGVVAPCIGDVELKGFADRVQVFELESCGDPERAFPGV